MASKSTNGSQGSRLTKIKDQILRHVPKTGETIGNGLLRKKLPASLHVQDDEYWTARNSLIGEGHIAKGRGRGGSVYLLEPEKAVGKKKKESDLYLPFEKAIVAGYIRDYDIDQHVIAKTAHQGGRKTRGKWTRPDLTLIAMRQFQFIPGKKIEIITFEVKPNLETAIDGVFEALAHSAFAHRSYLAVDVSSYPDGETLPDERIVSECERFGLGYITFEDVNDYDTYEVYIPAKLKEPESQEADEFIATQVDEANKNTIRSWWHS